MLSSPRCGATNQNALKHGVYTVKPLLSDGSSVNCCGNLAR
jgi:hypothetical protein